MLDIKISEASSGFNSELLKVKDLKQLEDIRVKYLSRNGLISKLFDELKDASKEDKPLLGKSLNVLRNEVSEKFNLLKDKLENIAGESSIKTDLSLPGVRRIIGSKHLLTQTLDEVKSIFKGLGFSVMEGPELESDYNNFSALNFPVDHPARDMQDTFL